MTLVRSVFIGQKVNMQVHSLIFCSTCLSLVWMRRCRTRSDRRPSIRKDHEYQKPSVMVHKDLPNALMQFTAVHLWGLLRPCWDSICINSRISIYMHVSRLILSLLVRSFSVPEPYLFQSLQYNKGSIVLFSGKEVQRNKKVVLCRGKRRKQMEIGRGEEFIGSVLSGF
jgi:hypothetical protein